MHFVVAEVAMALIVDEGADRMRIIAPIADASGYGVVELKALMEANYHSALDARYAISDGVVYAAFIHPLSPLTESELEAAVIQVVNLVRSFGSSFSSTDRVFGAPAGASPTTRR